MSLLPSSLADSCREAIAHPTPMVDAHANAAIRFGDFLFDPRREQLIGPDGPRPLRRQALAVLGVLLRAAPALVTIDELLDRVWGHRAISASALPQAMRDLRRALGDDARRPTYIETRLRRGYRLLPVVVATQVPPVLPWLRPAANDA